MMTGMAEPILLEASQELQSADAWQLHIADKTVEGPGLLSSEEGFGTIEGAAGEAQNLEKIAKGLTHGLVVFLRPR
jgi:hypothetical protein